MKPELNDARRYGAGFLRVAGGVEICLLIFLFCFAYCGFPRLDTGKLDSSYGDSIGYFQFSSMILDGSAFGPEAAKNLHRLRRPPGFPFVIAVASSLTGLDAPHALARVHFFAGLAVLILLWISVRTYLIPGSLVLALLVSTFFERYDAFIGAIPEWTTLLSVLAVCAMLIRFLKAPSRPAAYLLMISAVWIVLLKAAFICFLAAAAVATWTFLPLPRIARMRIIFIGVSPLLIWCSVNLRVLGSFTPAQDLGFNLFGIISLLEWPTNLGESDSEIFHRLESKRIVARPHLFEFLNSKDNYVGALSPQDFNIWVVGLETCQIHGFGPLACEQVLRSTSVAIIKVVPGRYLEYIYYQFLLSRNRDPLIDVIALTAIAGILTCLRRRFPLTWPLAFTAATLGVITLVSALVHAAAAQLYYRYLFPCHIALWIFTVIACLSGLRELLRRVALHSSSDLGGP